MSFRKTTAWLKNDIKLNPDHPFSTFYHGQWDSGGKDGHATVTYLVYRFLFMMTLLALTTYVLTCASGLFYTFFPYWSLFAQNLYGILYFLNIVWRKCICLDIRRRGKSKKKIFPMQQQVPGSTPVPVPATDKIIPTVSEPAEVVATPTKSQVPATDKIIPTVSEPAEVVPTPTKSEVNFDTVAPTDLNPTSDGIKSNDNNVSVTVRVPSSHIWMPADNNGGGRLTLLEKVLWILMNITQTIPLIVAVVYWTLVHKYKKFGICKIISNWFIIHSATAIIALIDILMVAVPARLTHCIFPVLFISAYFFFSYSYEDSGGRYEKDENGVEMKFIYSVLNWKEEPDKTWEYVAYGVLGTCAFHTIACWMIYKIKVRLLACVHNQRLSRVLNNV